MADSTFDKIRDISPELAYRFINESMSDEAWAAIDKCLCKEEVTPEGLAQFIVQDPQFQGRNPGMKPAMGIMAAKAFEHRKWLLDLGIFDKGHGDGNP